MIKGKIIILSSINFYESGPLSVYKDFISTMPTSEIIANNQLAFTKLEE